jgi:hypothetical protein
MKLLDIHHEFTFAFREEVYTLVSIKHWIHELRTGPAILMDETRPRRVSIEHIDMPIPKQPDKIRFAWVRSLSDDMTISKTTVRRRLMDSFQFKYRHFIWVPHMLMQELRHKCVKKSRSILETLETQ